MEPIEPAPTAPQQQAERLAARIHVLQQAIADSRGLAAQIALLERQHSEAEAELARGQANSPAARDAIGAELAEKRRRLEAARLAREELQRIDPLSLRGLR
jgi:hypothetical protein